MQAIRTTTQLDGTTTAITRSPRSGRITRRSALLLLGFGLALGVFASTASALDDIAIGAAAATPASEGSCPALTAIKYPWSNCGEGFSIGFVEGPYGEPPQSQCRLYLRDGVCAATTEPWNPRYLGIVSSVVPEDVP